MKTIILVRHGKAVERIPDIQDLTRSLVKRGEKVSRRMAVRLKERGVKANLLVSSTAKRALETANIFARVFRYPLSKIRLDGAFYHGSSGEKFLPFFRKLDDKIATAFLFGHEPTLSEFAASLVSGLSGSFPKSGIVGIGFDVDKWKEIEACTGSLNLIEYPGGTKKSDRLLARYAKRELQQMVGDYFAGKNPKAAKAIKRDIKKAVTRLCDKFIEEYAKRVRGSST